MINIIEWLWCIFQYLSSRLTWEKYTVWCSTKNPWYPCHQVPPGMPRGSGSVPNSTCIRFQGVSVGNERQAYQLHRDWGNCLKTWSIGLPVGILGPKRLYKWMSRNQTGEREVFTAKASLPPGPRRTGRCPAELGRSLAWCGKFKQKWSSKTLQQKQLQVDASLCSELPISCFSKIFNIL